jgi:multiphosphoryl transfer protein
MSLSTPTGSSGPLTELGSVTLLAPVRGVLVPLETVPDPVFAQKMVGEGISLDPMEGALYAPADGEIVTMHPAAHALTMRTDDGLEILVHIGLDTVHLRGEGFTPAVTVGDRVKARDLLITFDLDHVATHAKSLLTQLVVTNAGAISGLIPRTGFVEVGDPVADCALAVRTTGESTVQEPANRRITSPAVLVPNPTGLHARPAATLARQAQQHR